MQSEAGRVILELILPFKSPEARHALPGALLYLSKMRAHVAAGARAKGGALYL